MSDLEFVDPSSIKNKDFLEKVKDMILCSICTGLLVDPKRCKNCENNYCNNCITKWLKNSQTCPFKCQDFELKDATKTVKNILEKLIIDCPHCDELKAQNYESLIRHIKECKSLKINCPGCSSLVEVKKIKDLEVQKQLENEFLKLEEVNEKLISENKMLKEKIRKIEKSNNTDETELKLKDKCAHFKGNYMPIFSCCNKALPCYLCHEAKYTDHDYEISDKAVCLVCNNIYSGVRCTSCNIIQVYKKK